jgi:predicted metal-dependent peptidase
MTSTRVAADPIAKARIVLLTNHPYYGSLALRLIVEPDETIPTACTDGLHLFYNPQFTDKLTLNQRVFVFAHEANHCAKLHIVRRQMRDMELWNCAADFQINLELKQDGFDVIPGSLIDPRFAGMAVEQIYAILDKEEKAGKWKRPQMQWNFGGFIDAPKDAKTADGKDVRDLETEWKVAVQTAAIQAKKAGKLPSNVELTLKRIKESKADWRDVIRRYIVTVGDFSWSKPNRRHPDFILPGAIKTQLSWLVIAVDTSGSTMGMLDQMAGELNAILAATGQWPQRVSIIYWDAKVQRVDECENEVVFKPVGGGGTQIRPTFQWIEEHGESPDVLIVLTDGEFFDAPDAVEYPVIWCLPPYYADRFDAGFGETVEMLD